MIRISPINSARKDAVQIFCLGLRRTIDSAFFLNTKTKKTKRITVKEVQVLLDYISRNRECVDAILDYGLENIDFVFSDDLKEVKRHSVKII